MQGEEISCPVLKYLEECLSILPSFPEIQQHLNEWASLPIVYWPVHFLVISWVAFISFALFHFYQIEKGTSYMEMIIQVQKRTQNYRGHLNAFKRQWAMVTGVIGAALIDLEFHTLRLAIAVLLGLLGPYFLRDKLLGQVFQQPAKDILSSMDEERNRILRSGPEDPYALELGELRQKVLEWRLVDPNSQGQEDSAHD